MGAKVDRCPNSCMAACIAQGTPGAADGQPRYCNPILLPPIVLPPASGKSLWAISLPLSGHRNDRASHQRAKEEARWRLAHLYKQQASLAKASAIMQVAEAADPNHAC